MSAMRGLTMFISDIRQATSKEIEQKRVDKELAHIRQQFAQKNLDGYQVKKYTWKLLYMYMLGYDIDIGHMEALKLITSNKYSEKNSGYMACATLWNENTEFLKLMVQSVKKDLGNTDNEIFQCQALAFVGNIGGAEFAESLAPDVQKLIVSGKSRSFVRKKAALTLLRLFRKNPECVPQEDFCPKLLALLDDPNLGVVLSVTALLLGLVSHSTVGYTEVPAKAVYLLAKIAFSKERKSPYRYYLTLCPWLQVKLLRLLQYFPPAEDKNVLARLNHVLNDIMTKTAVTKNVNKNNADHSILFEAINVIIHMCHAGVKDLQANAIGLLGRFISIREPNFRYLGLDTMTRLAAIPGTLATIKKHHDIIKQSLQDPDVSIRKRALDLLYTMCDKSNSVEIVAALLQYLPSAPIELREELVLKIAILGERFATDRTWYLDVILQLISVAGDFVTDDIWYRVVQIVTNHQDLQDYAATTCFKFLQGAVVHENGVKVAAYILGEFSDQIKEKSITGTAIFQVLDSKFGTQPNATKAIMLSAYVKLANTYPELKDQVQTVFTSHKSYVDTDIQQRAVEYAFMNEEKPDLMETVFDVMPNFSERESLLLKKIKKHNRVETDKPENKDKKEDEEEDEDEEEEEEEDDEEEEEEESEEEDDEDEDDDEDGEGTKKKEKPKAAPKQANGGGTIDLFGFGATAAATEEDLFPVQPAEQILSLYGAASGVLYESKLLQIGLKLSGGDQQSQVKMAFYYGNRAPFSLKDVSVSVPVSAEGSYKIQCRPEEPFEVPPKKQVLHFFLVDCFKPFSGPLTFSLSFNYSNKQHKISLRVPIILSNFIVPTTLEPPQFIAAWQKYGNEVVGVRKLQGPKTDSEFIKDRLTNGLKLFLVNGVEKVAENFVAAGTFHTGTKTASGQNVTMPCLVRVEVKPGVVRITSHSGHQTVSDALLHTLTQVFNGKE